MVVDAGRCSFDVGLYLVGGNAPCKGGVLAIPDAASVEVPSDTWR